MKDETGQRANLRLINRDVEVIRHVAGVHVVVLRVSADETFNENVFGISDSGDVIWQVPRREHIHAQAPYVGLEVDGERLWAFGYDGVRVELDPSNGAILDQLLVRF